MAVRKPTESLDAWDLYLRALALRYQYTEESIRETVSLLERALAIDPSCAPGAAMIGSCRSHQRVHGFDQVSEAEIGEAVRLARTGGRDRARFDAHPVQSVDAATFTGTGGAVRRRFAQGRIAGGVILPSLGPHGPPLEQYFAQLGLDFLKDFRRKDAESPDPGFCARDRPQIHTGPEKFVRFVQYDPRCIGIEPEVSFYLWGDRNAAGRVAWGMGHRQDPHAKSTVGGAPNRSNNDARPVFSPFGLARPGFRAP